MEKGGQQKLLNAHGCECLSKTGDHQRAQVLCFCINEGDLPECSLSMCAINFHSQPMGRLVFFPSSRETLGWSPYFNIHTHMISESFCVSFTKCRRSHFRQDAWIVGWSQNTFIESGQRSPMFPSDPPQFHNGCMSRLLCHVTRLLPNGPSS